MANPLSTRTGVALVLTSGTFLVGQSSNGELVIKDLEAQNQSQEHSFFVFQYPLSDIDPKNK